MFMVDKKTNVKEKGFALLMSLIVVGVVLSVGLTILDLSIKQVRLSTNAKESEIAFHAANAGVECARYWRRVEASNIFDGNDISGVLECFGESEINYSDDELGSSDADFINSDGNLYRYQYEFSWGADNACTSVDMLIFSTDNTGSGLEVENMEDLIAGYPADNATCSAGSVCTVLAVKGYNRSCPGAGQSFGPGTIEREVLLQF
jgi:hypothetical protein